MSPIESSVLLCITLYCLFSLHVHYTVYMLSEDNNV